ncbi:SDR family oxidoreductase [Nocardioides sp. CPCC 206347]|uniref:SDR family oxidoreductase n=1 Tax=unclassified Nocardioides TaxID=2615069 RepID=UPI0036217EDB
MIIEESAVLVTGANGGVGRQFVSQFIERGARKVYAGTRREMTWDDDRVVPLLLDVTDSNSMLTAVSAAGDISVLVNNAGVLGPGSLLTSSIEEIRATFETNLFGPLALVRAFAATLARAQASAVVDVHSTMSWLADPGPYSASKAALWGLTNSLRLELAGQGTQMLGAHFGPTDTPMIASFDVAKADPADVVANILDALEAGAEDVYADDTARRVRERLAVLATGVLPTPTD